MFDIINHNCTFIFFGDQNSIELIGMVILFIKDGLKGVERNNFTTLFFARRCFEKINR